MEDLDKFNTYFHDKYRSFEKYVKEEYEERKEEILKEKKE